MRYQTTAFLALIGLITYLMIALYAVTSENEALKAAQERQQKIYWNRISEAASVEKALQGCIERQQSRISQLQEQNIEKRYAEMRKTIELLGVER